MRRRQLLAAALCAGLLGLPVTAYAEGDQTGAVGEGSQEGKEDTEIPSEPGSTFTYGDFSCGIGEDGTVIIFGLAEGSSVTELVIPEQIGGKTVTRIVGGAFRGNKVISSVSFPNTLTNIDEFAFAECTKLAGVSLPESLVEMGKDAFAGCDLITEVTIPGSLEVYWGGFRDCESLESIYFEDGVSQVAGWRAIADCPKLTEIRLPDTLTYLGEYTFENDVALTEIKLPEGLEGFSSNIFGGCTGLASVTLPVSMQNVGADSLSQVPDSCIVYVKTKAQYDALQNNNPFESHPKIAYVEGYPKEIQSISLDRGSVELDIEWGENWDDFPSRADLQLTVSPAEAVYNEEIIWSSSNEEVVEALVDYDSTRCGISGLKPGKATVTATMGEFSTSCEVIVFDKSAKTVRLNDKPFTCSPRLDPDVNERWEVSDTSVARITATSSAVHDTYKISNVTLTPLKVGKTTVSCYDGSLLIYQCSITVTEGGAYYLDEASVYGVLRSYPLTSGGVRPKPIVTIEGITLQEGIDYTLSYQDNDKVGYATMTITGIGQCVGTRTLSYQIVEGEEDDTPTTPDDPDKPQTPSDPDTPDTPENPDTPVDPVITFPDVDPDEWYGDAVEWVASTGAMTGYADGTFGPADTLSRSQLATVLWRLAGEPEGAAELPADCDVEAFYSEAVSWALGEGIFSGYESGSFGPADALTREQAATVLWRAAGSPEAECDLSGYPDAGDVSEFASAAMRWAVSGGVLRGQGDGTLDPQGICSRAEVAALLMRLSGAE